MLECKYGPLSGSHGLRRKARFAGLPVALFMLLVASGCDMDSLLSVNLPGNVEEGDLRSPALAGTLANSAQTDFECAFPQFVRWTGIWTLKIQDGGQGRPWALASARATSFDFYADPCLGTAPNYAPLQTSRVAGARAVEIISGFTDAQVPNRQALLARSRLYEAYSTLLLSETYCAVTFDNGPLQTRAQGLMAAEQQFTQAIEHATSAGGAVSVQVRNAALIGRARARLNRGDAAGVVADASQVADGFVFHSTHAVTPFRRQNYLYDAFYIGNGFTIGPSYLQLRLLEGVPDPRVPLQETDRRTAGGNIPIWEPGKLQDEGSSLVIGSWREAMLMIAEVQGGQAAVDIINQLRATVASAPGVPPGTYNLPVFQSSDPAAIQAQVREERRRETFLMGTEVGDLLRWGGPWPTGADMRGRVINDENTCMHVPEFEVISNPNFDSAPTTPT